MRLGKLPARINATQLKLGNYLAKALVANVPAEFGQAAAAADYPLLGGDELAVSVWTGAAQETMIWAAESGRTVTFSPETVAADYAAVTGYTPDDPTTDQGTDLQAAASHRRVVGITDIDGARHRIGAYVALTPGDPDELAAAVYIFGVAGVGLRLPAYALEAFRAEQVWDVRLGLPPLAGGHYVPVVGRSEGRFLAVTWGRVHPMSEGFLRRYCDETLVYFTPELLLSRPVPGFDSARLLTDLKAFTRR